jgi:hypothetical protein
MIPFAIRVGSFRTALLIVLACLVDGGRLVAQPTADRPLTLSFARDNYLHRWSKAGQHEFTPKGEEDLSKWNSMVTLNVHEARTGDQLAKVANGVLGNYQRAGKILRTDSKPRTAKAEAEHLIAAVLINPAFLEAAFARILLHEGQGLVIVYSKRVYGTKAGNEMSAWLEKNGAETEGALMAWSGMPPMAILRALR